MAKEYLKGITVRGGGASRFPIDMLRYDHAWPRAEKDARLIANTFDDSATQIEIELCSFNMPNRNRWSSFGWEVLRVTRESN